MGIRDITRDLVLAAITEHGSLGADRFRAKYGFDDVSNYVVVHHGVNYELNALMAAAASIRSPIRSKEAERDALGILADFGFQLGVTGAVAVDVTIFGEVEGVPEGTLFGGQVEAFDRGVHGNRGKGIAGRFSEGASSVIMSGGYEDDEDHGDYIIYSGEGGRGQDRRPELVGNQTFLASGNAALLRSYLTKSPVRVLRGAGAQSSYGPEVGCRYDGLFRVESAWRGRGKSGHQVCLFKMVKLISAGPTVAVATSSSRRSSGATGNSTPGRYSTVVDRVVRSTEVSNQVKRTHNYTCQVCGERLVVGDVPYAEGAHIKALGRPHNGPDIGDNVLCLCPNCHLLFDYGALIIAPDLTITLNGESVKPLRTHQDHFINEEYLESHRQRFAR